MSCLFAVTLLYFACGVVTGCLFLRLAKEWPYIMQKWTEIDLAMESYGFPINLRRHLKIVAISIMTAAACELNNQCYILFLQTIAKVTLLTFSLGVK